MEKFLKFKVKCIDAQTAKTWLQWTMEIALPVVTYESTQATINFKKIAFAAYNRFSACS
jgi:hypothetical protein